MTKRPLGFTDGVIAALGGLAVIAALVLAVGAGSFAAMAAVAALVAHALIRRPPPVFAWIAIVADLAILAVWLDGLYAPIWTVAGNVSG